MTLSQVEGNNFMSCHAVLCHVLCCVRSCEAKSCHVVSSEIMCHVMSWKVKSCHVMTCHLK